MKTAETITLTRNCEAIEIPSGEKLTLPAGARVTVTQALGGTVTVSTERGALVRIAAKDADALGKPVPGGTNGADLSVEEQVWGTDGGAMNSGLSVEEQVWGQLKTCFDPEIPANIVDLGLVYACRVTPLPASGSVVEIVMTLTAPGCGMGQVLKDDVQQKVLGIPGVAEAHVEIVVDPPWDQSRMSEAARLQLGLS